MSKTIDVRGGDTWTVDSRGLIWQYRNNQCRVVDVQKIREWVPDKQLPSEQSITSDAAHAIVMGWGYTLTRDDGKVEGEKQAMNLEQLAASGKVVADTYWARRASTGGDEAKCSVVEVKSATATLDRPRMQVVEQTGPALRCGDEAKPADVPVVDAVWVEWTNSAGNKCLLGHTDEESAKNANRSDFANGTARIVRVRSVDEQARQLAKDGINLANHANADIDRLNGKIARLESRLAAVEKPADKDAARVVLPTYPYSKWTTDHRQGFDLAIGMTRSALTAAGVKWEEGK